MAQDFRDAFKEMNSSSNIGTLDVYDEIACSVVMGAAGQATSSSLAVAIGIAGGPWGWAALGGGLLVGGTLSVTVCSD